MTFRLQEAEGGGGLSALFHLSKAEINIWPFKLNYEHTKCKNLRILSWKQRLVNPETFVQSDEKTWHDQKNFTKTKTKTKTKEFWEHLLRAILETCDLWNICSERWEDMTKKYKDKYKDNDKDKDILSNPRDLWHLRRWLQFWQLRTWIHDNLCDLTINCDTGQHSQFLQCLE